MIDQETIYRALNGMATPEEEKQIGQWYEESPEECTKAISEIHSIIDIAVLSGMERAGGKRRSLPAKVASIFMKAAAVAVLVAAGGYMSHILTWDRLSSRMASIEAPFGEQIAITLPDSSTVRLNSGAKITYPSVFGRKERKVSLEGEALFDVRHDEEHPFIVSTFASEVKVLGTRFNINADIEEDSFTSILLSGKVKIKNLRDPEQEEMIMHPNDVVSIKNGVMSIGSLESTDEICWTEGLIDLRGEPFEQLMRRFEKAFNTDIVIKTDTMPDISDVRGKIRINDGIVNALRILQHTSGFRFSKDEETNTITIY